MEKKWTLVFSFLLVLIFLNGVIAEKLQIDVKNNYVPGENVKFKIFLYNDNGDLAEGEIGFFIKDVYTETRAEGKVKSGEETNFFLPENAERGYWEIDAKYNSADAKSLFNVGELEKADIKLEDSKLIITNVGNVPYTKTIQISIGEHKENARVPLDIGQKKEIRLTAPAGVYEVRVNDGSQKEDIIFSGVSLTGNVIGLERISKGFWKDNPMISLFLITLIFVILVIIVLKIGRKYFFKPNKIKSRR